MKKLIAGFAALALTAFVGCTSIQAPINTSLEDIPNLSDEQIKALSEAQIEALGAEVNANLEVTASQLQLQTTIRYPNYADTFVCCN